MTPNVKQIAEIGFSRFRLYTRTYDVFGYYYTVNKAREKKYDKTKMFVKNVESEKNYFGMNIELPITCIPNFSIIIDGYGVAVDAEK